MKRTLITFILILFSSLSLQAQTTTAGKDFWLTFGRSPAAFYDTMTLQIRIVADEQAVTGKIYFTHLNDSVSFSVAAWSIFTHTLTSTQRQAACNRIMGISDYSAHIITNNPVAVYALNRYPANTDATNILPVTALGTDYYNISYGEFDNITYFGYNYDAYGIVATQNNTQVYCNNTLDVTLNRGEVYYRTAITNTNPFGHITMTGYHIIADKPVALFALCQTTDIPYGFSSSDNLYQQLAPIQTWGTTFFVPVSHLGKDIVRIMASQNGTTILQSGGSMRNVLGGQSTLSNLKTGEWVELEVSLDSNGCYIQTNKPVGVCTYLTSKEYNKGYYYNYESDPSQAWLPAIEQRIKSALIAPFIPNNTTDYKHYALIITPTDTKDSTTVKIGNGIEQALSGGVWHDHSSGYSFYDMPLTNDTSAYLFTNTVGKLIVMCYGTRDAESYYYLAASAMRNLAYFEVDSIHYLALDGSVICNENIEVEATIKFPMDTAYGHLRWFVDSVEQTQFTDSLHWTKQLSIGKHTILMVVKDEDGDVDSLFTSFTIQKEFVTIYDTICQGDSVLFNGKYYTQTGIYTDSLQSVFGCDSIVTLHLFVNPTSETIMYDTVCQGDSILFNGKYYTQTGIYTDTLSNTMGCDSMVFFHLTVRDLLPLTVNLGNDTTICWLDSLLLNAKHLDATHYQWQDGSTGVTYTVYSDGEYWVIITNPCSAASDTINISYLAELELNIGSDTVFCDDDIIDIQIDITSPYASYLWQDGSTSPLYRIKEAGIYSVTVSNACMSISDAIEISTRDCKCKMLLPNIFTPQNGRYVYLPTITGELNSFSMVIYNRWGSVVYKTNTYTAWNGKIHNNGEDVAEGVYFCVVEYTCKDTPKEKRLAQSSITVVR